MTPDEYAQSLRLKIESLRTKNTPFQLAVLTSVATVAKRAFSGKQNDKGQSFSYNSTDPIYISDDQSPRKLSRKGKTGRSTFESTGQPHKTTYFNSYKDFRDNVDRKTDAVNWQLTGDLMSDYGSLQAPGNKNPPNLNELRPARKINVNEYITALDRPVNIKKYNGLSDRYGDFLQCSDAEEKQFFEVLEFELNKFLTS